MKFKASQRFKKLLDISKNKKTETIELNLPLSKFKDNSFATIWSPNMFWSENVSLRMILNEHRRILKENGRIITMFPDQNQKKHLLQSLLLYLL